ncbi:hypothetical protein M0805_004850 [Coniferiporia weirii]|nr:hypothetical protein M0805_004850 [Coniferiporia weirii]
MVSFSFVTLVLAAVASTSQAGPLKKRIAQTIADSTAQWEQACDAAGGGEQCNPLSVTAFTTLLAAAGPCDQQNAADQMIDLAKTLSNSSEMITLTQIFVQQPRNSPDSFQVLYCQSAPANSELNGLFQCQFDSTLDTFTGGIATGAAGTVPFGLTSLATPRSCPANPQGGITDGSQLVDLTQDPGLGNVASIGSGSGNTSSSGSTESTSSSVSTEPTTSAAPASTAQASCVLPTASPSAIPSTTASSSDSTSTASSFLLQNGQEAQQLNAQFATLTANSTCNTGENACIGSSFALCANGQFALMDCGAANNVTCAALPLVNKAGTSVACVTQAEALSRIAATGATGGLTGSA